MNCLKKNHQNSLIVCICLDENCHNDPLSCQYCVEVMHSNHKNNCTRFRNLTQIFKVKEKELHQLSLVGLNQRTHQRRLVELYNVIINKNYQKLHQHLNFLKTLFIEYQYKKQKAQLINEFNKKQKLEEIENKPYKQIKIQTKNNTKKEIDYNLLVKEAHKLYSQQDFKKALRYYNRALKFNQQTSFVFYMQSKTLLKLNHYKNAITQIKKALKLCTHSSAKAQYFFILANALFNLKENQKSLKALDQAIQLQPKTAGFYFSKSLILKQLHLNKEAIEQIKLSIEQDPQHYHSWGLKGNILLNQCQYEQAIECFNKVIDIKPSKCHIYYLKGYALSKQKKYFESLNNIDICLKMKPDVKRYQYQKAYLLSQLNRMSEARYLYENRQGFNKYLKYWK